MRTVYNTYIYTPPVQVMSADGKMCGKEKHRIDDDNNNNNNEMKMNGSLLCGDLMKTLRFIYTNISYVSSFADWLDGSCRSQ